MSTQGRWLRARDFLKDFVNTLTEVDRVGLITFGDTVERRVAIEALSRNAPRLKTVLKDLLPSDTESRLFDAVHAALQEPAMRGRNAINVLLLVSPGVDEGSGHTLEQDRQELSRSHVQLVPVSYGGTGDLLRSLADSGRGQVYDGAGDPSDLSEQIASCF
jgi:hypothetical protein